MTILDKIVAEKKREVMAAKARVGEPELRRRADARTDFRDFRRPLRRRGRVTLIAEVKKASPSAGVICENFDPVAIATQYEQAGASACSVLTDEKFFQGHLDYLAAIRAATKLPLLRKDFVIDEYQVYESAAAGADAILLIVAILEPPQIRRLLDVARQCRLAAMVEVHDRDELSTALTVGAGIIGINNRNLKDFSVNLATTEQLAKGIGSSCVLVAESGIHTRADVERVRAARVDAILVGESLMRSGNIAGKVRELVGPVGART